MTDISRYAELAIVERNGFAESRHFGSLVGLSADGSVALSFGEPGEPVLPRSAAKLLQALACRVAGVRLTARHTAVSVGSHTGESRHILAVREILAGAKLDESALACPAAYPEDEASRDQLVAEGQPPAPVYMNCSGKHAAMLAACVTNGWDVAEYLDPNHPLQKQVRATIEGSADERVTHTGVDGCGAPLFGLSLLGLARATRQFRTAPIGSHERVIVHAMQTHPFYVGGTGHPNTEVMRRLPGVICKGGAEGVLIAAAATGETVAVKVIDGSSRATTSVALAALTAIGVDTSAAEDLAEPLVLGGDRPVGRIRAVGDLRAALGTAR